MKTNLELVMDNLKRNVELLEEHIRVQESELNTDVVILQSALYQIMNIHEDIFSNPVTKEMKKIAKKALEKEAMRDRNRGIVGKPGVSGTPIAPTLVIVNGKEMMLVNEKLSYDDIVTLISGNHESVYSVVYTRGRNGEKGILSRGKVIDVTYGMIINADITGNA